MTNREVLIDFVTKYNTTCIHKEPIDVQQLYRYLQSINTEEDIQNNENKNCKHKDSYDSCMISHESKHGTCYGKIPSCSFYDKKEIED